MPVTWRACGAKERPYRGGRSSAGGNTTFTGRRGFRPSISAWLPVRRGTRAAAGRVDRAGTGTQVLTSARSASTKTATPTTPIVSATSPGTRRNAGSVGYRHRASRCRQWTRTGRLTVDGAAGGVAVPEPTLMDGYPRGSRERLAKPSGAKARVGSNPTPSVASRSRVAKRGVVSTLVSVEVRKALGEFRTVAARRAGERAALSPRSDTQGSPL